MLVGLPGLAFAEASDSWYVGLGAGANWLDDIETTFNGPGGGATPDAYQAEFDTGWMLAGAVGYNWEAFRLELELGYRTNDTSGVSLDIAPPGPLTPEPGLGGDVSQFSQMVNMIFDIPLGEDAELSLGGGLGGVMVDVDIGGALAGGGTQSLSDDDYVFAYQAIAGLSLDIAENTELFGEYRYFGADKVGLSGVNTGGVFPGSLEPEDIDLENHSALIGIRFFFGEEAEPLPPEPAPVAPMTNFTIYFNKKGALTSEAHATITEAADVSKGGAPVVTIEAVGGGPRGGDAVARALEDLGIPAEKIAVENRDDGNSTITITN
jgi:opacity protein-like surface antigen